MRTLLGTKGPEKRRDLCFGHSPFEGENQALSIASVSLCHSMFKIAEVTSLLRKKVIWEPSFEDFSSLWMAPLEGHILAGCTVKRVAHLLTARKQIGEQEEGSESTSQGHISSNLTSFY